MDKISTLKLANVHAWEPKLRAESVRYFHGSHQDVHDSRNQSSITEYSFFFSINLYFGCFELNVAPQLTTVKNTQLLGECTLGML